MNKHLAIGALSACAFAALFATGRIEPQPAYAATDEQKKLAWAAIERNAEAIATLSDNIYYFAELGMQEHESTKLLTETLQSIGFRVRTGDAGFPTNVWAELGSGSPRIAIVTEVDALPEGSQTPGSIERKPLIAGAPGHMEGHNTHAGVTVGAAYALKQVMNCRASLCSPTARPRSNWSVAPFSCARGCSGISMRRCSSTSARHSAPAWA